MAESKIIDLSRRLEAATRNADAIGRKFSAHIALHGAAVLEKDKDQMLEHRQAAHVILDKLLDNGELVQKLSDELITLTRP